jgi:2-polyprenyl-6-methoxyphenol hydroxylase-like FAD-dependent oxidoreductase
MSTSGAHDAHDAYDAYDAYDADVAIVGYGPVGSCLAVLLAQLNHRVIVVERQPTPYPLPRAVHFDHETGRILQACGVGDALRRIIEPAEVYEWRNAEGKTLLRFGRVGLGASGWHESSMFNQPELETLLDERACSRPGVEVRRGVAITGIEHDDAGVRLSDEAGATIRTRFAVGCDGANSAVRRLLGTPMHDLGFFYDWLIVDVILSEPRVFDPINLQVCDPNRPTTVVSGGPGRRRWEFMRLPHESLDELNAETRAWELLADWDVRPDNARMERHAVYTFNARYAEQWRTGRVLLAGDAAHQMPPFAGQGMCAGLRDAANLAWKLDLVLTGRADDELLDAYEQERRPSAQRAIEFSMELGKVICIPDPEQAAARDAAMAAQVGPTLVEVPALPPITEGIVHPEAPHAGQLFVQGVIEGRLFDDLHGVGWRLVTVDEKPLELDDATRSWFASLGGRVVVVGVASDAGDGIYERWFTEHDATWALQRPDFHLYGTATTAADAAVLVRDLRDDIAIRQSPKQGV